MRADPESASQSERSFRDAISAGSQYDNRGPRSSHSRTGFTPEQRYPPSHLGKRDQLDVSPALRGIPTSLRKATLREDHVAFCCRLKSSLRCTRFCSTSSPTGSLRHLHSANSAAPSPSSTIKSISSCVCVRLSVPTSVQRSQGPRRAGPPAQVRTRTACI